LDIKYQKDNLKLIYEELNNDLDQRMDYFLKASKKSKVELLNGRVNM